MTRRDITIARVRAALRATFQEYVAGEMPRDEYEMEERRLCSLLVALGVTPSSLDPGL